MNATFAMLVPSLGWALIDFFWQGALVGLAALLAMMLLRNARPQARYAVGCAALALCLALPVAGTLRSWNGDVTVDASPAARFVQFTSASDAHGVIAAPVSGWHSAVQVDLPWIVALWSIGAALLAARMAMGMMWVSRAGRVQGEAHPRWQRRLDHLAERIGVGCKVRLRLVADLASPVAAGCWKPIVLVPAALVARMPLDLVEALLAHELAHIRRHDYLVNLLQSAIEALLFYHPVVWWLSKQIRIEREQVADDIAARALGNPQRLALALHELDLFQETLRRAHADDGFLVPSLIPAANGGHLMSRIQRLIRPSQHALSWKIAFPIIGLTAACLTVYAHDAAPAVAAAPTSQATPVLAPADAPAAAASAAFAVRATAEAASAKAVRAALASTSSSGIATRSAMLALANATSAAAEAANAARIVRTDGSSRDAYAIVHANRDGISMSGDSKDIPQIENARKHVHGDFIWTRQGGRTYIVQDPALIAQAEQAWKPGEAIDQQMEALESRMKVPEEKMEALSRQMEQLGDDKSPAHQAMDKYDAQVESLDRDIETISSQIEAVGGKMEQANTQQRESLERQLESLQAKLAPLTAQMQALGALAEKQGRQIEAEQAPLEQLGKQMEEEGKPMEALGKEMEALGKQEEELGKKADVQIRAIIQNAVRAGKAIPADSIRQE